MRPIESSNLRVDRIVNRAREFYQLLFNFEAMVSDERFCAWRAGPDMLLLFNQGGSNDPVVIRGGIIPPLYLKRPYTASSTPSSSLRGASDTALSGGHPVGVVM
jgi:hypothetical protein